MQRIYIDIRQDPFQARAATSGEARPSIRGILGTQLDLVTAFFKNGETEALPDATTGGKFTLKKKGDPEGAALLLDVAWDVTGTGAARTYTFSGSLDTVELVAAIGADPTLECSGTIQWTLPGETKPRKCEDFDVMVVNSSARPEDEIPATTDSRWEWLKAAAPEANGFTHNDADKEIAVAGGGAPEAHAASHAAAGSDPVTLAQAQITNLTTDLAAKAPLASPAFTGTPTAPTPAGGDNSTKLATTEFVKTAVDALVAAAPGALDTLDELASALGDDQNFATTMTNALAGKEPSQTAASQAEAEAGTETASRKWSPLRIKQAIDALASGGGGGTIELDNIAWVETDGNDSTGTVGDPAAPYLTMSAAYDDGARVFMLGAGTFAGLSKSGAVNVRICGQGRGVTTITLIESSNDGGLTVQDIGFQSCTVTTISREPPQAANATNGTTTSNVVLRAVKVGTLINNGGQGGNSDVDLNNSGVGGDSGNVEAYDCEIATLWNRGGMGGNGSGNDIGGTGGSAGSVTLERCKVTGAMINAEGGEGGDGATEGNGGTGGAIYLRFCRCESDVTMAGGTGAFGGSAGSLTAFSTEIAGALGGDGTIDGRFIHIGSTSGTPTINMLLSSIGTTTY